MTTTPGWMESPDVRNVLDKETKSSEEIAVVDMSFASQYKTQDGRTLAEISEEKPTLLVFLRHLGCTFCREALADIGSHRTLMVEKGIQPVFVHMAEEKESTQALFDKYGVGDLPRISDPDKGLYRAFGLERGSLNQVIGLRAMLRGTVAAVFKGHGFGMIEGDPFQMPGVFLIHQGKVLKDYRHEYSSDRPDYPAIGECRECR